MSRPAVAAPAFRWLPVLLFLVGSLASTIQLKIGQIQYLEIINLGQLGFLLVTFARRGYEVTWFRPLLRLACFYLLFLSVAFTLALASLRFDFIYPAGLNALKFPVVITLSRMLELCGNVGMMLYLADVFRSDPSALRFTMRVYFWTGVASALYSILSYPLNVAGIVSLGVYSDAHRSRGFYNEGGPYGLYVVSLFLVAMALYRKDWERKPKLLGFSCVVAFAFFMSQSKAAIFAMVVVGAVNVLYAGSLRRRLTLLAAGGAVLIVIAQKVDLAEAVQTYRGASASYERFSHVHRGDVNFIYGRVAGAFIVPRMIAAHPLTGIGWGNYGLLRNAPEFRGASAWADIADDPGLGLAGAAADLGIPLLAFLMFCLLLPTIYLRRLKAPLYLVNLAMLQPLVHVFGAQLNLTYPWIVTAFAMGLAYSAAQPLTLEASAKSVPVSDRTLEGPVTSE